MAEPADPGAATPGGPSAPAAVETRGLRRTFGSFAALDGLTLRIEQGTVYGLLGPNGAGKTTAVRILCGLLRATSGEAYVLGLRPGDRRVLPRIGYLPQELGLYLDLTVRQNLALFGTLFGMGRAAIAQTTERLLALIGLEDWADAVLAKLSGGMRRRVSLAVSMVHDPELLVLDEPTVGVDPELRASFWQHFAALKSRGRTVLITTHYMDEAGRCDRVGLVRGGRLIAEGAPAWITASTRTATLEEAFLSLSRRGARGRP